jgi:hypothetical protein
MELTEEVVEEELERLLRLFPPSRRPRYRNSWRDLVRPEFLPLLSGLVATPNGDLWVQKYAAPNASPPSRLWWIISDSGELRGMASVPGDFELRRIWTDYAIGIARDSFGVQYVEKRRLRAQGY